MAEFMIQNVVYRATVYRTGIRLIKNAFLLFNLSMFSEKNIFLHVEEWHSVLRHIEFSETAWSDIFSCSSLPSMFVIDLEHLSVKTVVFFQIFLDISSPLPSRAWLITDSSSRFFSDGIRWVILVQQKKLLSLVSCHLFYYKSHFSWSFVWRQILVLKKYVKECVRNSQ